MFHRVRQYQLIKSDGQWYRPKAYGTPASDGTWEGWLVFFPTRGGPAIAPPRPETTQSTLTAVSAWAAGLTPVYLEGAFTRASRLADQAPVIGQLARAEYEALEDAERLEEEAAVERTAADLDEVAADVARNDAEHIRRARRATEATVAATEEAAAEFETEVHEQAADNARAIAADAGRRRRAAEAEATSTKRRGKKRAPR